jgi:NTE family protein
LLSCLGAVALADERPKIGLVLSGGGARGAAHVGVIKRLEEQRVPIDYIAGTSMGAIVGGLYAAGTSSAELEEKFGSIDWLQALGDSIPREDRPFRRKRDDDSYLVREKVGFNDGAITFRSGLVVGQNIELLLRNWVQAAHGKETFDDLAIPFRAVTTDLANGSAYVIGAGDLARAMRASMSIPAFFAPVEIDGRILVDGGIANNLPINVVRDMGADIVIAVDLSTPLRTEDQLKSLFAVSDQLTNFLTRGNTEKQLATLTERDVLIIPELGALSSVQFDRSVEAIAIGYAAASESTAEVAPLAIADSAYAAYTGAREPAPEPPVIEFVKLNNRSRVSDDVLMARLQSAIGVPLGEESLTGLAAIYGLDLFQRVQYEVVSEDGKTGLLVDVEERSWGPNYLQFGLELSGDLNGSNELNIAAAYTRTAINRLGGEWRTGLAVGEEPRLFTELYQPLDVNSRFFVQPLADISKRNVSIFDGSDVLAQYRVTDVTFEFSGGRNLGNWGELRAGYRRGFGDSRVAIGESQPKNEFDRGETYFRLTTDKLDNLGFPQRGFATRLEVALSRDEFGADDEFEQVEFGAVYAQKVREGSFLYSASYATTLDNDAPIQDLYRFGGFQRLSGFTEDELSGQHRGLLKLGYLRPLGKSDLVLVPVYIGASLEWGNVWNDTSEIDFDNMLAAGSIYLGADTFFGPLFLAYGHAEGGRDAVYLLLGQPF